MKLYLTFTTSKMIKIRVIAEIDSWNWAPLNF